MNMRGSNALYSARSVVCGVRQRERAQGSGGVGYGMSHSSCCAGYTGACYVQSRMAGRGYGAPSGAPLRDGHQDWLDEG